MSSVNTIRFYDVEEKIVLRTTVYNPAICPVKGDKVRFKAAFAESYPNEKTAAVTKYKVIKISRQIYENNSVIVQVYLKQIKKVVING